MDNIDKIAELFRQLQQAIDDHDYAVELTLDPYTGKVELLAYEPEADEPFASLTIRYNEAGGKLKSVTSLPEPAPHS